MTDSEKAQKLNVLVSLYGYDSIQEMLETAAFDSVVPAICTAPGCEASYELEPDCCHELCVECRGMSVDSCLILAGVI
jgi:hypothetical protein